MERLTGYGWRPKSLALSLSVLALAACTSDGKEVPVTPTLAATPTVVGPTITESTNANPVQCDAHEFDLQYGASLELVAPGGRTFNLAWIDPSTIELKLVDGVGTIADGTSQQLANAPQAHIVFQDEAGFAEARVTQSRAEGSTINVTSCIGGAIPGEL
jgi:hypothetical protein